ncbi:MAG TPA: amidohydrolase family protein, partial [Bryobacteraceae bacterium]
MMRNRRQFIQGLAAGMAACGVLRDARAQVRREVRVGGKRVKVVDIHAHATFPEVADVIKEGPLMRFARTARALGPDRIQELDKRGIDIQVVEVNTFWWYDADRDLASKIVQTHDEGLAKWCAAHQDRFIAFTSPALQFPDLAVEQLDHAVKQLGMRGVALGGHVKGEPLSTPKYDPFWAKVEDLGLLVFMHPNNAENIAKPGSLGGSGDLNNVIGNPLETTLFLSRLILDGTLDRFPRLKICAAHGGGYIA